MKKVMQLLSLNLLVLMLVAGCTGAHQLGFGGDKKLKKLNEAINNNDVDKVRSILSTSVNLNKVSLEYDSPLHGAAAIGHVEIATMLLDAGANVNIQSEVTKHTPLHAATESGNSDIVRLLLERNADLQITNQNGRTPLDIAASAGRLEIANLLLQNGAIVDRKDHFGLTPLHNVISGRIPEQRHLDTALLLLKNGAGIDIQDHNGMTPLMRAVQYGRPKIVQLLLENGAGIDIQNNALYTPLMLSISVENKNEKSLSVVKLLTDRKQDFNLKNKEGKTALEMAKNKLNNATSNKDRNFYQSIISMLALKINL